MDDREHTDERIVYAAYMISEREFKNGVVYD
jgi:hypothetical protein